MSHIEIKNNFLVFSFDGIKETFGVGFERTLKVPDNNQRHQLPPSLGRFPLEHVDDYAKKLPKSWSEHGGIFLPMYQSEAMWLSFSLSKRPFAVKVASGKINAVSGGSWKNELDCVKQDYMVDQPWLDGFYVGRGAIRQFVAVNLDSGYTVEEQVTGKSEHGGLQIVVYPMKSVYWEKIKPKENPFRIVASSASTCDSSSMGMAAGGLMSQEIYEDKYGVDAFDQTSPLRVFIHLSNSKQYKKITGRYPGHKPLSEKDYKAYQYPWFEYYCERKVLKSSKTLNMVESLATLKAKTKSNNKG